MLLMLRLRPRPCHLYLNFNPKHCRTIFNASAKRRVVKQLTLRASPSQTLKVVSDVGKYAEFLPFCTSSTVDDMANGHGADTFAADLVFEWGSFKETIRHQVSVDTTSAPTSVISRAQSSRVAKEVIYSWTFTEIESNGGTKVDVELSVEFNSLVHAAIFDLQIEQMSSMMM